MQNMIRVDNLSVSYGNGLPDIISNMSFELGKGCVLNILGQNAVGKTTLIRTLMRDLQNYRGSIKIKDTEINNYSIQDFAKMMGVVSTSSNTYQNLLVADYLVTGLISQMSPFAKPGSESIQKSYEVLSGFGKQELFNKHLNQLSSGERQIVMIVRVLLQNPQIIIFDEPTANLDVKNQIAVLNQIKHLSSQGYTVLVTTHNPGHAYSMGGKTLIMGKGKYRFGDTNDVVTEQILSEYYDLDVTMHSIEDSQCIILQNKTDINGVKLIF